MPTHYEPLFDMERRIFNYTCWLWMHFLLRYL